MEDPINLVLAPDENKQPAPICKKCEDDEEEDDIPEEAGCVVLIIFSMLIFASIVCNPSTVIPVLNKWKAFFSS